VGQIARFGGMREEERAIPVTNQLLQALPKKVLKPTAPKQERRVHNASVTQGEKRSYALSRNNRTN
jgi:hypothetical protein